MALLLNAYCTHRSPPRLAFPHELNSRRDGSDPELASHLRGFMGFIMDGGRREMNASRYHLLQHLKRVQHHVSLNVEERDMGAFERWATEANAVIFFTDSTVRAPDGQVLFGPPGGDAAPGAVMPHPRDAFARKSRTDSRLAAAGIRVMPTLPPVVSEIEVELRPAQQVVARVRALLLSAIHAESLREKEPGLGAGAKEKLRDARAALTPEERGFTELASAPAEQVEAFIWRYEAIALLAWSAGLLAELPFPAKMCDVGPLVRGVLEPVTAPKPRSAAEVLDELDLHYRLNWAVTDARVNGGDEPAGVQPGVVFERHYALNWLTRFDDAEWDDVQTPT